jgi:allophanate hydrolase subunit 2
MADRQTSGGYTRIANVITADLHLLAQMKPGDTIHFRETTIEKAQEILGSLENIISEYT